MIPKEIQILRPDILVFLTGPGHNMYYDYILENFTLEGEPQPIPDIPFDNLMKLPLRGVKLAYKTFHPGARMSEAEHWKIIVQSSRIWNTILTSCCENF